MDRVEVLYGMYGEEVTAKITIKPPCVFVENYTDDIFKRPFGKIEQPTYEHFLHFLEERCFPRTRGNCRQLLKDGGMDYYQPYEIVKKSHGAMSDDMIWLRFGDEDLTTWDEVNPRIINRSIL